MKGGILQFLMNKIINSLEQAVSLLKEGKVGIFPTDTAFGIGCRIDDVDALKRVYAIRNRPKEKALLALVGSFEMAGQYVVFDENAKSIADKFWPGALTIVLNCNTEKVPSIVRAEGKTLAVRMPDHEEILQVIEKVGVPIVAPSANFSGEATPFTLEMVSQQLIDQVDFVLTGMCKMNKVSTIVDGTTQPATLVREGAIPFYEIINRYKG